MFSIETTPMSTEIRTPRRYGWRVEGDGGRYAASCCRAPHYPQARESQQQGTQGRQRGRLQGGTSQACEGRTREGVANTHTGSTSTNTLGVVALLQQTVDTTDRELETGLGGTRLRLASLTTSLARGGLATVDG